MNLHQFRFVQEAVRRNLNLTETAKALHTSQPGISKAIIELEEELGVDIFARHGKRIKRVTEPGMQVLKSIEAIMGEVANLRRIGDEYSKQDAGTLSIATTHTQARYFLPGPISAHRKRYPKVQVVLHQGMPEQVVRMLLDDVAELGLATEALATHPDLISLPCHEWQHVMVVPASHALAAVERPTLAQLAAYPLVLYHPTVTGRSRIDLAFERERLTPTVALEAIDSDVIKTYVRLGLGVGVVTELAMHHLDAAGAAEADHAELVWRPLGHLFGSNLTRVAFKRGAYLRQFVLAFTETLSARLTPAVIEAAVAGRGSDYQL